MFLFFVYPYFPRHGWRGGKRKPLMGAARSPNKSHRTTARAEPFGVSSLFVRARRGSPCSRSSGLQFAQARFYPARWFAETTVDYDTVGRGGGFNGGRWGLGFFLISRRVGDLLLWFCLVSGRIGVRLFCVGWLEAAAGWFVSCEEGGYLFSGFSVVGVVWAFRDSRSWEVWFVFAVSISSRRLLVLIRAAFFLVSA